MAGVGGLAGGHQGNAEWGREGIEVTFLGGSFNGRRLFAVPDFGGGVDGVGQLAQVVMVDTGHSVLERRMRAVQPDARLALAVGADDVALHLGDLLARLLGMEKGHVVSDGLERHVDASQGLGKGGPCGQVGGDGG